MPNGHNHVAPEKEGKENTAQKVEEMSETIEKMYPAPKSVKWDSFDIVGKIGSGGFGEVFLAELKENKARGIN